MQMKADAMYASANWFPTNVYFILEALAETHCGRRRDLELYKIMAVEIDLQQQTRWWWWGWGWGFENDSKGQTRRGDLIERFIWFIFGGPKISSGVCNQTCTIVHFGDTFWMIVCREDIGDTTWVTLCLKSVFFGDTLGWLDSCLFLISRLLWFIPLLGHDISSYVICSFMIWKWDILHA